MPPADPRFYVTRTLPRVYEVAYDGAPAPACLSGLQQGTTTNSSKPQVRLALPPMTPFHSVFHQKTAATIGVAHNPLCHAGLHKHPAPGTPLPYMRAWSAAPALQPLPPQLLGSAALFARALGSAALVPAARLAGRGGHSCGAARRSAALAAGARRRDDLRGRVGRAAVPPSPAHAAKTGSAAAGAALAAAPRLPRALSFAANTGSGCAAGPPASAAGAALLSAAGSAAAAPSTVPSTAAPGAAAAAGALPAASPAPPTVPCGHASASPFATAASAGPAAAAVAAIGTLPAPDGGSFSGSPWAELGPGPPCGPSS